MIEYQNTIARVDGPDDDPPEVIEPSDSVRYGYIADEWELVSTAGGPGVIVYTWRREIRRD